MPELPENIPKIPFAIAIVLALLGFVAIIFAGGSLAIMMIGMLLVLSGGGVGLFLGLQVWKATE